MAVVDGVAPLQGQSVTAVDRLRALAATKTGSYGEMYALRMAAWEIADLIEALNRTPAIRAFQNVCDALAELEAKLTETS